MPQCLSKNNVYSNKINSTIVDYDVKLLDVTLRDGGYKTNFNFSYETIDTILNILDTANIEYIEVGYRNGSFKPISNIGLTGICANQYLDYCRSKIQFGKLTVILHPKNVNENDIREMRNCDVQCIRICVSAQDITPGLKTIELAKKYGFEVFVNLIRASQYTHEQLHDAIGKLVVYKPNAVYLADSNGSFTPEKAHNFFAPLALSYDTPLGFHAHDNLFLAQANAVAAIKSGVTFIDASLYGLGKGAGNLRTEAIASFLLTHGVTRYNLSLLLKAAKIIKDKFSNEAEIFEKDIIMGMFNLSQDDATHLGEFNNFDTYYTVAKKYCENNHI